MRDPRQESILRVPDDAASVSSDSCSIKTDDSLKESEQLLESPATYDPIYFARKQTCDAVTVRPSTEVQSIDELRPKSVANMPKLNLDNLSKNASKSGPQDHHIQAIKNAEYHESDIVSELPIALLLEE